MVCAMLEILVVTDRLPDEESNESWILHRLGLLHLTIQEEPIRMYVLVYINQVSQNALLLPRSIF